MSVIEHESSDVLQVIDNDGYLIDRSVLPSLSDNELVGMYEDMRLIRHFDEKAINLQRQGRISTYASLAGQEGAQVGSAYALDPEDWIFPTYRDHGACYVRGMKLMRLMLDNRGFEKGNAVPEKLNIFTSAIPIATQIPHAVGMAMASKYKDEKKAFLCYFGDGATSEGDFHEGLNFAGVFDTPNIFFCNNNQYAISVPREKQTASKTISQKANAYGFKGVQVDGMDPLAVYKTTKEAVDKAKNPKKDELRPTLIEAVQYRFNAHTTADDPSKYRDEKEVEKWREKDPLKRLRKFLTRTGRLDTETDDVIQTKVEEKVSQAVEEAESFEPDVESMFRNVYDEMTPELRRQLENLNSLRERIGDETFRQDRS